MRTHKPKPKPKINPVPPPSLRLLLVTGLLDAVHNARLAGRWLADAIPDDLRQLPTELAHVVAVLADGPASPAVPSDSSGGRLLCWTYGAPAFRRDAALFHVRNTAWSL